MVGDDMEMSISKAIIEKLVPDTDRHLVMQCCPVWDEVIMRIVDRAMELSRPHIDELHIDLREEMILELVKLQFFVADKVVQDRITGRLSESLSVDEERECCLNGDGLQKIENTARMIAEHVWIRKYRERWKPKTKAALRKEKNPKIAQLHIQPVYKNHFISEFFIRDYWTESGQICRYAKNAAGNFDTRTMPFSQWGYSIGLYTDRLEAYFSLIEGDAACPIRMLLRIEPMNGPQKKALVGFIVIQRLRNPHFIASIREGMRPIVRETMGQELADDDIYMQRVYESLYGDNKFYDRVARPVFQNRWVLVRAKAPQFVLPDTCNVWGSLDQQSYVVMPFTPTDCLVVLPMKETTTRVIPFYINPPDAVVNDITTFLIGSSVREFLASQQFDRKRVEGNENTAELAKRITKVLSELTCET